MIDITEIQLEIVKSILKKNLSSDTLVWVFGSRATKTNKPFSDLDLAIDTGKLLPYETLVNLKCDFEESDLPWKVDVVDWHSLSLDFQQRIGVNKKNTRVIF